MGLAYIFLCLSVRVCGAAVCRKVLIPDHLQNTFLDIASRNSVEIPILNKLKEIDPESVKWRKYFWRRSKSWP